jgi:hypothetical protein
MIKRIGWGITASALTVLVVAGCGAGSSTSEDDGSGETFTRTVVRIGADGAPIVTSEAIDPAAQRERAQQRIAGAAPNGANGGGVHVENCPLCGVSPQLTKTSCDGSSIWLYDRAYYVGNEICFFDFNASSASARLLNYSRLVCTPAYCSLEAWDRNVASWEAGSQRGAFEALTDAGLGEHYRPFAAWESDPVVTDDVLYADQLLLWP